MGVLCKSDRISNSCAQLCPVGKAWLPGVPQKFHNRRALSGDASPIAKFAENLCFAGWRRIRNAAAPFDRQPGRSNIRRRDRRAFGPARGRRNDADQFAAARTLDDETAPSRGERIHDGRPYGFTARSCEKNSSTRARAKRVAAAAARIPPHACHKTVTFIAASQPIAHRHMRELEVR